MKKFGIGIDNYGLHPLQLSPMDILRWAKDSGAEGVQFSGLDPEFRKIIDKAYLKDLALFAGENNLYIEWGGGQHIPRDMSNWSKKDLFAHNEQMAKEAEIIGTRIVRSCSGGLMRWNPENHKTEELLRETAKELKSQHQMLQDHHVILAIETHFEFTTFELGRLFDMCEAEPGDWLGICLDTMNLLTMLEDPVSGVERILPWVVSTHIKDGGLKLASTGLVSFPTEIGRGAIDLRKITTLLETLNWDVSLSIEDHGGEFHLPIFDSKFLKEFPDLTAAELLQLLEIVQRTTERKCTILPREKWAEICEERLHCDILSLKKLVND